MKSNKLLEQIHERMGEKSTGELLTIWKDNDRGLWSEEAFKVIEEILSSREVPLPPQRQIKNYMTPIFFTIVWFIYFAKSKWIAERIQTKPYSNRENKAPFPTILRSFYQSIIKQYLNVLLLLGFCFIRNWANPAFGFAMEIDKAPSRCLLKFLSKGFLFRSFFFHKISMEGIWLGPFGIGKNIENYFLI